MLSFARMWGEVRLPEGYDPAEFAYSQTVRSDWRLEVDQAYYTRDVEAEDASTILTLFAHLQDWLREEQKLPFCPVRKLGKLLDKSPQYVAELIRCLRAEGALVEVEPGTTRRSPRYRVVDKQSDRKSLKGNYRRSRRLEEVDVPGGLEEGTEDGARFHNFLDGEVIEEDLGEDVPGGGVQ